MMREKWILLRKGADYAGLSKSLGADPLLVRIMRNRGLVTEEEMRTWLYGTAGDLHDPHLMKDVDKAAQILLEKIRQGRRIRVIGDYDIDGVMATYILLRALKRCGASADYAIPDRITDGYGVNPHLIEQAAKDGVDTILTCDNGIAAFEAVACAGERGMTVIVTDHHQVPYTEKNGIRTEKKIAADAVVNPHQEGDVYPYKELCGAAVAYKLVLVLYEKAGIDPKEADEFLEQAGFATIGDVMDLTGENRILAKLGLAALNHTRNIGMRALIAQNGLSETQLKAWHVGFRLGPCLNAGGRLETADLSLKLLLSQTLEEAVPAAIRVTELNEQRKSMTELAVAEAEKQIRENGYEGDRVLVLFLPDCHESLAGIVAGRIREAYHRPVLVIARGKDSAKGSGRSIEAYSMYEELCGCGDLLLKYGGHPMAAGFSLKEEKIGLLRQRLNAQTTLTEEDLRPVVRIDADMPADYVTESLIRQMDLLEPFGKANEKPVFACRQMRIRSVRVFGKHRNVCRLDMEDANQHRTEGVFFGDPEEIYGCIAEKYGKETAEAYQGGRVTEPAALHICYYPNLNEYNGSVRIQFVIRSFS